LIGPHGAGLTNLLYCGQKSKIGEIAVNGVFPHYLGMAHQSGHSFQRFLASKAGEQDKQDMVVDVAGFEQWLDLHFKNTSTIEH
jgi:capsular polysaccharide biosynthesis protein